MIGIYTFEVFQGRKNIGSSRIRGHWVAKAWGKEAEIFRYGQKYDAIIYQKAYAVEHAKIYKGIKILDLCDADFLHWGYRTKEMIEECHAVTTSTEALAQQIRRFTDKPVLCIPDRLDLEEISVGFKEHLQPAQVAGWYGYSQNFDTLKSAVVELKRKHLSLLVISDKPFYVTQMSDGVSIQNRPHKWETVCKDLLDADIIINPTFNKGRWKYKSNNKTILAWALGLPVAHDGVALKNFLDPEARARESLLRRKEVEELYDVKLSVIQYQQLISKLS